MAWPASLASLCLYPQVETRLPEIQTICQRWTLQFAYISTIRASNWEFLGAFVPGLPGLQRPQRYSPYYLRHRSKQISSIHISKKVFDPFILLLVGTCSSACLAEKLAVEALQKVRAEGSVRVLVMLHDETSSQIKMKSNVQRKAK